MAYFIGFGIQVLILARLASRFGFSAGWAATAILPFGPVILLWVIAFSKWDFPDARALESEDQEELAATFE